MNVGELTMWITLGAMCLTYVQMHRAHHAWRMAKKELQQAEDLIEKMRNVQREAEEAVSERDRIVTEDLGRMRAIQSEIDTSKEQLAEGARLISEGFPDAAVQYLRSCGFSINQKRKAWH